MRLDKTPSSPDKLHQFSLTDVAHLSMAKLTESNIYIKTKKQRKDKIARSVISSSACEGMIIKRSDLPLNGRLVQSQEKQDPPVA